MVAYNDLLKALIVLLVLAPAGCSAETRASSSASAVGKPCPRDAAEVRSWERVRWAGELRADIDDDGMRDRTVIRTNPRAPSGCRYVVAAETGSRGLVAPLWHGEGMESWGPEYLLPKLQRVIRLGSARRPVLVIDVDHSAHSTIFGFWLVQRGVLKRVTTRFDLIANGFAEGSTGHISWTPDCIGQGRAVIAVFTFIESKNSFHVTESPYALRGAHLVKLPERERRMSYQEAKHIGQWENCEAG